ncbi:MAG: hypothetical protein KDI32_12170 [Pseudomonadales bacterium]|nr:hypothetical protein [Pseudomonadales bacterium]
MSEPTVDLSSIRGDWDFHTRYVTNAMDQTLKRLHKNWRALKAQAPAAGQVPVTGELMEEFIEACRQTRALTDDILLMRDTQTAKTRARSKKTRAGDKKPRAKK